MVRPLLAALLLLVPAAADEIVLTSGGRLSCEVLEEGDGAVKVRLPHGTMTIPRERIAEIVREDRGAWLEREARTSLRGGATATAVEMYEEAVRADPENADLRRGLGQALLAHARALAAQFRFDEARRALERLDPEHPDVAALLAAMRREEERGERFLEEGLTALQRGDFEGALRLLEGWRLRKPAGDATARRAMADAYLVAAGEAVREGRVRAALDHYRAAESFGARRETEEPLRLLRPIAVLEALKQGETDEARRLIDSIATTYPDRSVPVLLRAFLGHVKGEVEAAVADYAEAARLAEKEGKPERGLSYDNVRTYAVATLRAAIARPPQEGVAKWRDTFLGPLERFEGAYFVVYAPTANQAEEIGRLADELYAAIADDLLGEIPDAEPAELVVHAERQAYLAADQIPEKSPWAAVFVPRDQTAGVTYTTLGPSNEDLLRVEVYAGPLLTLDTLPHEIAHVVQHRGLPAFRRGHWLDEAVAMMYESPESRDRRLDRLVEKGEIMPLPELLALRSTPPDRVQLFYDQSYSVAAYLRDRGDRDEWRRFLEVFATEPFATAVERVYGFESLERLERGWLAALELGRTPFVPVKVEDVPQSPRR